MKTPLLALAILTVAGFSSCKQDYTCRCEDSKGNYVGHWTWKMSKKDAEGACKEKHNSVSSTTAGGSCSLD